MSLDPAESVPRRRGYNADTHRTMDHASAARANGAKGGRPRGSVAEPRRIVMLLAVGESVTLPWAVDDNGERKPDQRWARSIRARIERETERRYHVSFAPNGIAFHRTA